MADRFPPKPADAESRIFLNMRTMYTHEAKAYPKQQSPTAVTRGFEDYAFPKIVEQISSTEPIIYSKAVVAARELLIKPERLVLAVAAGITGALVRLLKDLRASEGNVDAGDDDLAAIAQLGTDVSPLGLREVRIRGQQIVKDAGSIADDSTSATTTATTTRAGTPTSGSERDTNSAHAKPAPMPSNLARPSRKAPAGSAKADHHVRADICATLRCLAAKEIGAADCVQHRALPLLSDLLFDPEPCVADAAFATLQAIAVWPAGKHGLVRTKNALESLVEILTEDNNQRVGQALSVLCAVLQLYRNDAAVKKVVLLAAGVPVACTLLRPHRLESLRQGAAQLLAYLCANSEEASSQAVAGGGVPHLAAMLAAGPYESQIVASAALGYITVTLAGKHALGKAPDGLSVLVKLLVCADEPLAQNLLQVIQNAAELPANRDALRELLVLYALENVDANAKTDAIRQRVASVIDGVNFKHWPFPVQRPLEARKEVSVEDFIAM